MVQKLAYRVLGSQGALLGDFLLATAYPIEKVTLWVGFLHLMPGSETNESAAKDKVFARTGDRTRDSGSKTKFAVH